MSNINYNYIGEYIRSILPEDSIKLKEIKTYADNEHVPIICPEVGQLIKVLLNITNSKNILEIGTAIGYSSILMAEATNSNTKITTIEKRNDMVEIAKKNIKESNYDERIKIIMGDAREILPQLEEKYDFIFLDAAKGHYLDFFNKCSRILKKDGVILSDNVLYKGMVANDELVVRRKKTIVKRMKNYLEYLSRLENYSTAIIPIGDGVALTYKKE